MKWLTVYTTEENDFRLFLLCSSATDFSRVRVHTASRGGTSCPVTRTGPKTVCWRVLSFFISAECKQLIFLSQVAKVKDAFMIETTDLVQLIINPGGGTHGSHGGRGVNMKVWDFSFLFIPPIFFFQNISMSYYRYFIFVVLVFFFFFFLLLSLSFAIITPTLPPMGKKQTNIQALHQKPPSFAAIWRSSWHFIHTDLLLLFSEKNLSLN